MEPASYVCMGRNASGRTPASLQARPGALPAIHAWVADDRSSDTPGPMVELIETFFM